MLKLIKCSDLNYQKKLNDYIVSGNIENKKRTITVSKIIKEVRKNSDSALSGDTSAIQQGVMETSRHITSTTLTTFMGFLPLILSGGGFWPPFATAIAGGVLLSTVVSFFFVPQMFLLLSRQSTKLGR